MKVTFEVEIETGIAQPPSPTQKQKFTEALRLFNEELEYMGKVTKSTWKLPPVD